MTGLSDPQLQSFRDTLAARARALHGDVSELDHERTDILQTMRDEVADPGDEAEARREEEVRSGEEARDEAEVREVEAALQRLDDGSFGECVECGVDIPVARLSAVPSAARCIDCQERRERAMPTV